MNYILSIALLLSTTTSFYCNEVKQNIPEISTKSTLAHALVDDNNNPTEPLLAILEATGIEHDGTLPTIFAETQKKWLRPAGQERWEDQTPLTCTSEDLPPLFEKLFLTQEIKPSSEHYNHALLLGATADTMRKRLAHLILLSNNGIRFDSIVVLAGKRSLDKTVESDESILTNNCAELPCKQNWQFNGQFPTTETEVAQFIFDQTEIPQTWNNIPLIFVDTPMQQTDNGTLRRPNTQDTIDEWLHAHNPKPGSILAISNQPYIGYQDAVLRKALPKTFNVETVGNACNNTKPTVIIDSLARWIYNEYLMAQKK